MKKAGVCAFLALALTLSMLTGCGGGVGKTIANDGRAADAEIDDSIGILDELGSIIDSMDEVLDEDLIIP